MQSQTKKHLHSITVLTGVLTIITMSSSYQGKYGNPVFAIEPAWTASIGSSHSFSMMQQKKYADKPEYRIAQRLQQRLRKRGNRASPPIDVLATAVLERQDLLRRNLQVIFSTEEDLALTTWAVSLQKYPLFATAIFTASDAKYVMNPEQITQAFERDHIVNVNPPVHAILHNVVWKENDKKASRAVINGTARSGYLPDVSLIGASVAKALHSDLGEISIPLEKQEARIINMTDEDMGDLVLWATGKSNYRGSTYSRKFNVEKALSKHVTNTVIAPGETFSFNSTLDGPVSISNGWAMAKVIFNGGDLEFAPGGGICQASTTVFRAIVNAGFPIVERRSHSLYVSYYKEHGVGIDATIYPGSQDLVFLNDSEKPLIIQAYNDGDTATVNVFGSPDGRSVELSGPYFASTAPEGFTFNDRKLASNEIVWKQAVRYASGEHRWYEIGSRYKTLPKYVAAEYDTPQVTVYASAPVASLSQ